MLSFLAISMHIQTVYICIKWLCGYMMGVLQKVLIVWYVWIGVEVVVLAGQFVSDASVRWLRVGRHGHCSCCLHLFGLRNLMEEREREGHTLGTEVSWFRGGRVQTFETATSEVSSFQGILISGVSAVLLLRCPHFRVSWLVGFLLPCLLRCPHFRVSWVRLT